MTVEDSCLQQTPPPGKYKLSHVNLTTTAQLENITCGQPVDEKYH